MSLTLWIRDQIECKSIEIDASASTQDLYDEVGHQLNCTFRLSFAGLAIDKQQGSLADVGLSNEAAIDIISEIPIWESMLRTFGDNLVDKEQVEWWKAAEQCRLNPVGKHLDSCSDEAICQNPIWTNHVFIRCHNGKVHRIRVDSETPFKLRGHLNLGSIPRTVEWLSLFKQPLTALNFNGLSDGKSLLYLYLTNCQIEEINLKELVGASLLRLHMNNNRITGRLDLGDLSGSNLRELYLQGNRITDITFYNMNNSPLQELYLRRNPIETIDFQGIAESKLRALHLHSLPHRHLLRSVKAISELQKAAIKDGGTYFYLMRNCKNVSGVLSDSDQIVQPRNEMHVEGEIPMIVALLLLSFLRCVLRLK